MLDASSLASVIIIIISNYNYARFVSVAIESTLALDWPNVEVIVVDDGTTDDSRTVIARYRRRLRDHYRRRVRRANWSRLRLGCAGRATLVVWLFLVCLVPRSAAVHLVQWRFVPSTRPKLLRRLMSSLKIARASAT